MYFMAMIELAPRRMAGARSSRRLLAALARRERVDEALAIGTLAARTFREHGDREAALACRAAIG